MTRTAPILAAALLSAAHVAAAPASAPGAPAPGPAPDAREFASVRIRPPARPLLPEWKQDWAAWHADRLRRREEALPADGGRPLALALWSGAQWPDPTEPVDGPGLALLFLENGARFRGAALAAGAQDLAFADGLFVSGLVTSAEDLDGVAVAGLVAAGRFRGAQIAGLFNFGYGQGLQFALLANGPRFSESADTNYSGLPLDGAQLALLGNSAHRLRGAQVALGLNVADSCEGAQIALLYNRADRLCGLQVGLVNRARSGTGVQIGLLNGFGSGADERWLPFVNVRF